MNIKIIYITFFCLFFLTNASGQSQNPFEIKGRLQADSIRTIENSTNQKSPDLTEKTDIARQAPDQEIMTAESQQNQDQANQTDGNSNPFEITRTPKKTIEESAAIEPTEAIDEPQKADKEVVMPATQKKSGNFLFWVILFAFLILAVSLSIDRWFVTKLFKGIFNYNLSNTMMRETSGIKFIILILLYFMFIITISIFAFLIFRYLTGIDSITYLYYSFAGVLAIYTIRHLSLFLLGLIFPNVQEAFLYNYSVVTFNAVTGIILIIPVLLMAFSASAIVSVSMYLGIVLFAALFILRSLRGMLIAFRYINNHPIHFFLYLCAFEIIPLMVVYKILTDFV